MNHSKQTRREFVKRLAASAVAAPLGPQLAGAASARKTFQLRYILASSMFGKTDLEKVLAEVKDSGSEFVDLWPMGHANQREQVEKMGHEKFEDLLKRQQLKLGMTTRYDLGPYHLQEEFKFVKKFGGRLIVSGSRKSTGKTLRDKVKSFVNSLQPHVALAEQHGITIGIENHGSALIETPDSLRYFGEFAKSPHLGIALAPYHLPQDETLLAKLIEDLGPKLVHFYAWEHGMGCTKKLPKEQEMLQLPGYGRLDFTPLLAAMKKTNYQGWTEVFMHPVPRGIPILEPIGRVTESINKSRAYLEECLKKA
jgi:sugar phosphate isomerase/epimerase